MAEVTKTAFDFTIRGVENGYTINSSWSEKEEGKEYINYKSRTTIFTDWDGVVNFITNNKLDIPPQI